MTGRGRHYLDHASTSPARPEVVEAMLAWLAGAAAADPGRVHTEGRMARAALEGAREQVAGLLGARPREVVFTSGATEAINAATFGATASRAGPVVAPAVEHSAVLDSSRRHRLVTVAVDGLGRVDPAALLAAVDREQPALVHVQWANHEVGTRQPVAEVVAGCRERGVLVHVDAAAGGGHDDIDFGALGADLLSVSAHKLGGPKGAGALLVRRGLRLEPLIVGGDQERARRGGIENVPAAVGFGVAAELAAAGAAGERARARRLTDALAGAALAVEGVVTYGDRVDGLDHLLCLGVAGVEAEPVLLGLDQAGIAAHSGSACASESLEPSPVLEAMGVEARQSLRLSVGWSSTEADVAAFAGAFPSVVARLRALAGR
ncbi:MAG TPA: cysteine desulfurase family protein [Acidimicrobiales bacterium]|nr:cysteine desulfurase family protein [Acidimicrobiales bacterium]